MSQTKTTTKPTPQDISDVVSNLRKSYDAPKFKTASYLILSEPQTSTLRLVAESVGYVLQDPPCPFESGGMLVNVADLSALSDLCPGLIERLRIPAGAL